MLFHPKRRLLWSRCLSMLWTSKHPQPFPTAIQCNALAVAHAFVSSNPNRYHLELLLFCKSSLSDSFFLWVGFSFPARMFCVISRVAHSDRSTSVKAAVPSFFLALASPSEAVRAAAVPLFEALAPCKGVIAALVITLGVRVCVCVCVFSCMIKRQHALCVSYLSYPDRPSGSAFSCCELRQAIGAC
jgi:hypothetical protein